MKLKLTTFIVLLFVVLATGTFAQRDRSKDPNVRSVEGTVTNSSGAQIEGAVVQLKNTKTLQVRSFITQADGNYHFHGLSTNVDYELKADHQGASSSVKTLSSFDSRAKAVINLKVESKK
ncbi:MAG: carboxypeptidase-like regulatory domain-containing protein [Bryobacterales bacterium]|nr:carboxypeptidase-like regulatory domain-containing protein [Bryobacterales bacterium]